MVRAKHSLCLCLNEIDVDQVAEARLVNDGLNLESGPRLDVNECVNHVVERHILGLLLLFEVRHDPLDSECQLFDPLSLRCRVSQRFVAVDDQMCEV